MRLQYFSCNLKCRLSENHILPLARWAWPQLPAVGSLTTIPRPAPSLSVSWNPLAQPQGCWWGQWEGGGAKEPSSPSWGMREVLSQMQVTLWHPQPSDG